MKTTIQSGFTLYELMITLAIVGVILAYGIPNMAEYRQNSRMTGAANDLHSSFHLARSEAARSKAFISICASSDSMSANPTCSGEFEDGWVVFEDTDGDVVVDAGEPILRVHPAIADGININSQGANDYFAFSPSGQGRGDVAGPAMTTVVFCDARGNQLAAGGSSAARVLVVTPLGRATVLHDEAQVTFHGGC